MRGTKSKRLRNDVNGNPLQRDKRPYYVQEHSQGAGKSLTLVCAGARRAYRVAKSFMRGDNPRPPLF